MEPRKYPREECGIFGIRDHISASNICYLGMYGLQHRGQESCGIVSYDGHKTRKAVGMGKVTDFFTEDILKGLKGYTAIGHVRYSTTGSSTIINAQPILVGCNKGLIATSHNGNIVNALTLRKELEGDGSIFQSTNDSEVVSHLIAKSRKKDFVEAVIESVSRLKGAFSILIMRHDMIIALRDEHGFRPLSIGKLGGSTVVASETSAFDIVDAEYIRDIEPGEMVVIDKKGTNSYRLFPKTRAAQCVFELIYFSRPNSMVFGESVYDFRIMLGKILAREHSVDADVVIPVPDSGTMAALGYSEESKIPFNLGLIRSHYIGRTFIEPSQKIRDFGVKIKFGPVKGLIKDKRVILVDDSLVRGTTSRKIVKLVRAAGAKEVHLRISAPPSRNPCYYGIDFPDPGELVANKLNIEDLARYLGVDSLGYISIDGMYSAMSQTDNKNNYCSACFDGKYPVEMVDSKKKSKFESDLPLFDNSAVIL